MVVPQIKVVDGRVEGTPDGVVTGWAWNPADPEERVRITVWVNGRPVASGPADQRAPGLKKVGIGDGRHAFAIPLPEELRDQQPLRVAVRADGAVERLPLLENWSETGAESVWSGVELVPDEGPLPTPPIEDDPPPPAPEPATSALTGRDGWLFGLTSAEAERLQRLRSLAEELQGAAALLEQLAIRYVVAVVPAKLAVHPEMATVASADMPRCARELEALARDSDSLEILDLLGVLQDARRHGPLFHPREERLSALGAFHVTRALVKRAGPIPPGLRPLPLSSMALAPTLETPGEALEDLPQIGAPDSGSAGVLEGIDAASLRALRMPAASHLEVEGLPAPRVYEQPGAEDLARAALVGDPVIHTIAPWLAESTARIVILESRRAPLVPIELEHPAVVFHVLDERRILAPG